MHTTSARDLWESRLPVELAYWDAWLASRGRQWATDPDAAAEEFRARFDPNTPLQDNLRELLADAGPAVRILDVGAGPATAIGTHWPGHDVWVTPIDPLAREYSALLVRYGFTPPIPTIAIAGEDITEHIATPYYDLAYARNSLDHSHDPLACVRNMLQVIKPGGCVYLLHHNYEAGRRYGEGLHQWDFFRDGDKYAMVRYTAGEPRTTHRLSLGASMTMRAVPPYDTEVVIRKPL